MPMFSCEDYEEAMINFIAQEMNQDLAHDMNHVFRVVKTAKQLCRAEGAMLEVVLPAAYLHDCFSFPKNHPERSKSSAIAADKALSFLEGLGYPSEYFDAIHHSILAHSYSANITPKTLEAKVVQDADRLDALGAIGIARCLQVSTQLGVTLYSAEDPFCEKRHPEDQKYSIDHYHTKLFRLPGMMQTASAREEAERRVEYMRSFLAQLRHEISI
ncbi:HD domain-containing protein [Vibrio maritimus]|uniref:HD domain-containing protein n=1 Tax=Vibrio maritimus TaxID=990268 RepID=UPI003AF23F96